MKDIVRQINILEKEERELNDEESELLKAAKEATYNSYSPYSHFSVGAALKLDNGKIITGSNQENCAYPSGLCAERTAMFYANANYPENAVIALCIAARDTRGNFTEMPVTPCGSCRQVLVETEHRFKNKIRIMLYGTKGLYIVESAQDLLPVSFDASYLE